MILSKWFSISLAEEITLLIVIVACILWITEIIPLFVTSLLILLMELIFLLPVLQEINPGIKSEYFLSPFFSDTVLLFLGGFVISAGFHSYDLDKIFAQYIVSKNSSSPRRLLFALIFTSAFLSLWMNNTATAALMIGLSLPIMNRFPKESGWPKAILLAIPFACNIGGMGTPVGTLPNAIAIEYLNAKNIAPSFLEWMFFSIPIILVLNIILGYLLSWFFCRNETENYDLNLEKIHFEPFRFLSNRNIVLLVSCLTILGWLTSEWHGLSNGTVALIPVLVLFGTKILTIQEFRHLPWDVLVLMGGGISMGRAIDASGLARNLLETIPIQDGSVFMVVVIFSLITLVLSSVMSNTSTANLMIPLALGLSLTEAPAVVIFVALAASVSMALPISTPPNAIAFGYGRLKAKEMSVPGIIITLLGWLGILTIGYGIMKFMGVGNL
jgi:sodium-dependent dicarboxylate transporter 2/3/5